MVATDFGSSSVAAVKLAADLASTLAASLTVLHVARAGPIVNPTDKPFAAPLPPAEEREIDIKRELDAFLERLSRAETPSCNGVIRFGTPAREILAYAEESACDLIVLGTHGRGLSRWVLGSVADKVVRGARVPVLTVPAEGPRASTAPTSSPP